MLVVTRLGVVFSTWVGASLCKLVVARVLLVSNLRLGTLGIREQSAWIPSRALAWAKKNNPSPIARELGWEMFVLMGICKTA